MPDVCVTVPKGLWSEWIEEGDLAGEPWSQAAEYHFWIRPDALPTIAPGDRVYIVAWGRLRGYAPLVRLERRCKLAPNRACLVRRNGAEAVTIPDPIVGFQGWRYRWWDRSAEVPSPEWRVANPDWREHHAHAARLRLAAECAERRKAGELVFPFEDEP